MAINPKLTVCLALVSSLLAWSAVAQNTPHSGTIPHEVLAFYYPWYGLSDQGDHGNHWGRIQAAKHETANTLQFPAMGAYSSYNRAVVDSHIDLAKSNGITGFIASWWGQKSYEDHGVSVALQSAEQKKFKISVFWEKEPGKGPEQITHAVDDLVYLVAHFGTNSAFLKVGGKPVIFVYERVLAEIPRNSWPTIIAEARAKAGPFLLIADEYNETNARVFDGLCRYNISWAPVHKSLDGLRAWAVKYDGDGVKLARQYHRISCATVIPGYDDTKVRKPGRIVDRQDGQIYRVLWEEAIKSQPDWVVITSWNEWHEGTEIEPSFEDGDKYLKLTAEYARRFLGQ
jgi:glycoprotein endo-alpha-1,2-mannosidase